MIAAFRYGAIQISAYPKVLLPLWSATPEAQLRDSIILFAIIMSLIIPFVTAQDFD